MTSKEINSSTEFKIGIVGPISSAEDIADSYTKTHWISVRKVIEDSYPSIPMPLVSESDSSGIILDRIIKNLADYDLIICDTSSKNPNVMFELGLRLAFDKPVILVKDELTEYSFDISLIEHVEYTSDLEYSSMLKFQNVLAEKIKSIKDNGGDSFLKHFTVTNIKNTLPEKEISGYDAIKDEMAKLLPLLSDTRNLLVHDSKRNIVYRGLANNIPSYAVIKDFIAHKIPKNEIEAGMLNLQILVNYTMSAFDIKPDTIEVRRKVRTIISHAVDDIEMELNNDKS
ncbi:UNVERIFIED_ORG: hypothetical protein ABIC58_000022 [Leuconostoc holzapfelii]